MAKISGKYETIFIVNPKLERGSGYRCCGQVQVSR